jgi:hypothetical protein
MMRAFAAAAISLLIAAASTADDLEEVEIIDRPDWSNLPVFYVDAPSWVKSTMLHAVKDRSYEVRCSRDGGTCTWLQHPDLLRYFRAVAGSGKELRDGAVCPNEKSIPHQPYYSGGILGYFCVWLNWDERARVYDLTFPAGSP